MMVGMQTDFCGAVFPLRLYAEYFLTEYFGKRCQDMHADCEICKRWNALDVLLENPFEGDGEI